MRCRCLFSGACPERSCISIAACLLGSACAIFTKFLEGVEGSIACSFGKTFDFRHASIASCFRVSLCACSDADLLRGKSCFSSGSLCCALVIPCAAFLASSSALSFPTIPLCPGVQQMVMSLLVFCALPHSEFCRCVTKCCPDAGFLSLVAMIVAFYTQSDAAT